MKEKQVINDVYLIPKDELIALLIDSAKLQILNGHMDRIEVFRDYGVGSYRKLAEKIAEDFHHAGECDPRYLSDEWMDRYNEWGKEAMKESDPSLTDADLEDPKSWGGQE